MKLLLIISAILLFSNNIYASAYAPYGGYPPAYAPVPQVVYPVYPGYPAPYARVPAPRYYYYEQHNFGYPNQSGQQPAAVEGVRNSQPLTAVAPAPEVRDKPAQVAAIAAPVRVIKPISKPEPGEKRPAPKKTVPNSKMVFLQKIAPMIHRVNGNVSQERSRLISLIGRLETGQSLQNSEQQWLKSRMKKYRVKGELSAATLQEKLLPKVDIIPVELALAQAANESAWGQSRFAREARNLFGVWTYDESKGIVPKKRAKGAKHLVRKYESMEESIRHYVNLLNSHPAYQSLRDIRAEQRANGHTPDGVALAAGLIKYSAKGEQYVAIIRSMIDSNNLVEYRSV